MTIGRDNLNDYEPVIRSAIRQITNDIHQMDREDLVQDVLLAALEHMVDGREVTPAWLATHAKWRVIDSFRLHANSLTGSIDGDRKEIILPDLETPEGMAALHEFTDRLDKDDREIISLLMEGNTQAEIAEEMDVSQSTISRRIESFREQLGE